MHGAHTTVNLETSATIKLSPILSLQSAKSKTARIALVMSPLYLIPPSAITGILYLSVTSVCGNGCGAKHGVARVTGHPPRLFYIKNR